MKSAKSSAAPATKFEELKKLAESATQSKWEHDGLAIESGRGTIARCPTPQNEGVFDCHQNAEYIAAANPKAILEILAAHQALYEALSALECSDCEHSLGRHVDEYGCQFDRGDGYRVGSEVLEALGPCACKGGSPLERRAIAALADAAQGEK